MAAQLELSKLEVARRQLETAIQLYFHEGDEVSTHTLAAAGYNVIRDIVHKKKLTSMIVKDMAVSCAKPEMRKLVKQSLNQAENFFKHADKDAETILTFSSVQTEYLLFDAEIMYQALTGKLPPLFLAFRAWFVLTHQNVFNFSAEEMKLVKGFGDKTVKSGRKQFVAEYWSVVSIAANDFNQGN